MEESGATVKKPKVDSIGVTPNQKRMMNRINEFNDAGMVVVQNHTFSKPDRVLWAMSTQRACAFYEKMPSSFLKEHPLLTKYNTFGFNPYNIGKYLTKSIKISMGLILYPQHKTRRLLDLFFYRTNNWKKIILDPSNEEYAEMRALKFVFYKMVFVLLREDKTCCLATEYIRTSFLVSQTEAKDVSPAKTTFFEIMTDLHLEAAATHGCDATDCTCLHGSDPTTCNCDVTKITYVEMTVVGHPLLRLPMTETAESRTATTLQSAMQTLFNSILLSNAFCRLREKMAKAMERCWSDWNYMTGYAAIATAGDTDPPQQKDWPLVHHCARIMHISVAALRACIRVNQYCNYNVNLGFGKHTMTRFLCCITRDSVLYIAFMAHSESHAVIGALRVLLYNTHFRIPWAPQHDPALSTAIDDLARYYTLEKFRTDYPYDDIN